jgi:hypothetical protein
MLPPQLRPARHVQHTFLPASINTTEPGSTSPRTPPPTSRGVKSQPAKGGQFLTGADIVIAGEPLRSLSLARALATRGDIRTTEPVQASANHVLGGNR